MTRLLLVAFFPFLGLVNAVFYLPEVTVVADDLVWHNPAGNIGHDYLNLYLNHHRPSGRIDHLHPSGEPGDGSPSVTGCSPARFSLVYPQLSTMIEENRTQRLEGFAEALEEAGYDVLTVEPRTDQTITERVSVEDDDTVGFVVVDAPVELGGYEFSGEVVVTVHEERVSSHGVDIYSEPDNELSAEERAALTDLVPPREVTTGDGESRQVWTYYPPPADLPDSIVDQSRDNLDEVMTEFEDVYQSYLDAR